MVPTDPAGGPGRPKEVVADYSGYDFEGRWKRREKVTEFERELVGRAMHGCDRRRVLEIGTGFGRLSASIAIGSGEYVALDFDPGMLEQARKRAASANGLYVVGNALHLPFVDGAFTTEVLFRVYHHLSDPARASAEVRRTLGPGGNFLVSYSPKPTVGTLWIDLTRRGGPSGVKRGISFDPAALSSPGGTEFPIFVQSDRSFRATWAVGGAQIATSWGMGLERIVGRLPASLAANWSAATPESFLWSSRLVLGHVPPVDQARAVPKLEEILACPSCQRAVGRVSLDAPWEWRCPGCAFVMSCRDRVVDARFLPPGAVAIGSRGTDRGLPTPSEAL